MKLTLAISFAGLLILTSLAAAGLALKQRFDQGAKTRIAICQSENTLRKILHDEHQRRLNNLHDYLEKHPQGIPGISRDLLVRGIQDEEKIVRQVAPRPCN